MPSKHRLFDTLFRRHSNELFAFAHAKVGNTEAEDLVQEAYLRFLQRDDATSIINPRAYLYKIIAHLSFDYHRKESTRSQHVEIDDVAIDSLLSPLPSPDDVTETDLLLKNCLTALDSLPEIYRHVFLLHRFDGLSHSEIANALQLPKRTVERYCAKALAQCFAHHQA